MRSACPPARSICAWSTLCPAPRAYNATPDCPGGALAEASGPSIFSNIAPDGAAARGINPVAAKVVAGCTAGKAPPLDLGQLDAGGLYTVWMMRPKGNLVAFVAHDTIAPPRS